MINSIENIADLKNEIIRLKGIKEVQEKKLREDILLLQDALEPANLVSEAAKAVFKGSTSHSALEAGLDLGLEFLTGKILLRKRSALTKFVAGIAIRNLVKGYAKTKKVDWKLFISNMINDLLKSKNAEGEEDESLPNDLNEE